MSTIKEKDLSLKKAAMPKKDYIEKIKCSAAPRLGKCTVQCNQIKKL